jgi:DNA repair protein RadD
VEDCGADNVFDITVENTHCFFANGLLVHNCHGSLATTWTAIGKRYENAYEIGWTATPCRTDGRGLGDRYDCLIQAATYAELQRDGHLVPVRAFAPSRPDLARLKISRGDYSKGDLEKRLDRSEMVGSIVDEWRKNAEGRQTVLFAAGVQHSIHCRNEFRKIGVSAEHIDGKMPTTERDEVMQAVREGDVRVLTNYGVAHTGVDVPQWKYLICARPTKSFSLWRQMGGRPQRPYPGHDHCVIQDHSDNCLVFGYPDEDVDWTLDTTEKIQERKAAADREKKKSDPFCCDSCKTVYRGPQCPKCGHKPEKRGSEVKMTKGELRELERKKANRAATTMDKQKAWDECLGWAVGTKKLVGAAAHRYRNQFGVFPNNSLQNVPRNSQWQMPAQDFYRQVVKPAKEAAASEYETAF